MATTPPHTGPGPVTALGLVLAWATALVAISLHQPFFWDSIYTGARTATLFWQHGPWPPLLPADADAGHPPLFGVYLAGCWHLFGRTLATSHIAMWPWLVLLGWQLWRLAAWASPYPWYRLAILALLLLEPTLMAQATLVSPEIPLVLATVSIIVGLLYGHAWQVMLAALLLPLFSARGILLLPALGLAAGFLSYQKVIDRRGWSWLWPGVASALAWLLYHKTQTGWYLLTPAAEWAGQREALHLGGVIRQGAVVAFRLLDQGRAVLWLFLIILLFRERRSLREYPLAWVLLALVVGFLPLFALVSNPPGHRYFLPLYLVSITLCCQLACTLPRQRWRWVLGSLAVAFTTAHGWVWPHGIAKGWDASLAYLPYAALQDSAHAAMARHAIAPEQVGTSFPANENRYYTHLSAPQQLPTIDSGGHQPYLLYSNVFNDDEEVWQCATAAPLDTLGYWQCGQVWLLLAHKKKP